MNEILVETKNISKEFSGVRVLNDINIEIKKGEIFGIIGENGAGKSTFIKILNGIYDKTEGEVKFEGKKVDMDVQKAKRIGINTIPQEFNLINDLNVYENIFLGKEYKKNRFILDKEKMRSKTNMFLKRMDTEIDPNEKISNLSVAQKQMVEIAKAIAYNSKLLIMDEPTTVLTPFEVKTLFKLMRDLVEEGITIIYISHNLKEVKEICDRVMVLRDGEFVCIENSEDMNEQEMANRMVGRELNQMFPTKIKAKQETVLSVKDLNVEGLLENITFDLKKGEILGFSGLVGAGRTELAETIIGIRKMTSGEIYINGEKKVIDSPSEAVKNNIAYLPEDRQGVGILTNFNIPSNITLISLKEYTKLLINHKKVKNKAKYYIDEFNIQTPSLDIELEYLSGGNQQKVSFSKCLDIEPNIIIFDEPTRGIDVNAKMEIFNFIQELVKSGISVIFISSELEEIIGMCSRVVVMRSGKITGILEGDHINEEEIMYHATGVKRGAI
ncbi:MAG: sugar ABC transporter ATP-binding protein [Halanaerobiales bacterium]|nr:sugar ABC transporter ATP-binding protein [Halanaerobiales bacterium]